MNIFYHRDNAAPLFKSLHDALTDTQDNLNFGRIGFFSKTRSLRGGIH